MAGKRICTAGILMTGLLVTALSGCGRHDDRNVLFGEETETALLSDSADEYPVIDEDSRRVVEWRLSYDVEAGETGNIFTIMSQTEEDDFEDTVIQTLKDSEYCGESMEYYIAPSVDYMITKDLCSSDYLDWLSKNDLQSYNFLMNGSQVRGNLDIVSTPTQGETVFTMPWAVKGGGYSGEIIYNLYAGDEISFLYCQDGAAEWNEVSLTIDRVTVDPPWYLNEASTYPIPILLLSWEEFTAMEEDPRNPIYVFRDTGENHELHELARSLRKEYTGKDVNNSDMGVFENQYYFE